jgi:hypothetical protein
MPILDGGYFVGAIKDPGAPIEFRFHGFKPLDVTISKSTAETVIDGREVISVADLRMEPLQKGESASIKGRVVLKRRNQDSKATATFVTDLDFINHPSNGVSQRDGDAWAKPNQLAIGGDGTFVQGGFSPSRYRLHFEAPGFDERWEEVSLKSGETTDVGTIELLAQRHLTITYRVARAPQFKSVQTLSDPVQTGSSWRVRGEIWNAINKGRDLNYGDTLAFAQVSGNIAVRSFYAPAELADLGLGRLEDFVIPDTKPLKFADAYQYPLQDGHVYLMNHKHFGYWVIFEVHYTRAP